MQARRPGAVLEPDTGVGSPDQGDRPGRAARQLKQALRDRALEGLAGGVPVVPLAGDPAGRRRTWPAGLPPIPPISPASVVQLGEAPLDGADGPWARTSTGPRIGSPRAQSFPRPHGRGNRCHRIARAAQPAERILHTAIPKETNLMTTLSKTFPSEDAARQAIEALKLRARRHATSGCSRAVRCATSPRTARRLRRAGRRGRTGRSSPASCNAAGRPPAVSPPAAGPAIPTGSAKADSPTPNAS